MYGWFFSRFKSRNKMNRRQAINKILHDHIDVNKHEDYTNYKKLITAIEEWHESEVKKLTIPTVVQRFTDVVQHDKRVFIGSLDEDNYIEIQYIGWNQKGLKSYKIQVWRNDCGCIYEEIKRLSSIDEAILCAVSNAT